MRRLLFLLAGLFAVPAMASAADLKIGESLSCTSPHPTDRITVVVGSIETMGSETVVGISFYNRPTEGEPVEMAHLPIALSALRATCTQDAVTPMPLNPDFQGGYDIWRHAVEADHAGFFTAPIDQVIDAISSQLHQGEHI